MSEHTTRIFSAHRSYIILGFVIERKHFLEWKGVANWPVTLYCGPWACRAPDTPERPSKHQKNHTPNKNKHPKSKIEPCQIFCCSYRSVRLFEGLFYDWFWTDFIKWIIKILIDMDKILWEYYLHMHDFSFNH